MVDESTQSAQPVPSAQKYILIAEDDRFYAHIYETKLTREGFEIKIVSNGEEVLAAAKERQPNLIVMDLLMPVKDGFDALRDLKADETLKDIPVIVVSNLGQDEDMQQALKLGAADYFIKANLSIEEMVEKVKKHVT